MKIIILATAGNSTSMLANAVASAFPDVELALETPVSRWLLLRRRASRMGAWKVFGQILFMLILPLLRAGSRRSVDALAERAGLDRNLSMAPARTFDSVNSAPCIAWLAEKQPDVIILNGTRIVSPAVLAACDAVFLNTHCGITPAYRGVHGAYWALYNGEPQHAGVTVHLVDAGIDTGDIIGQAVIATDRSDNFLTYPVKQYIAGIPLMKAALADIAAGRLAPFKRSDLRSAVWHHPTLWQYLGARWTRGVR
jgi:folate-dependent phosphoribosylglycinamide formyltransferase PurN